MSGTLPFDGPTLMELRDCIVRGQFRIPFFLSRECELLLKGLLVVDPERRLSISQIARHPWTTTSKGKENLATAARLDEIVNSIADVPHVIKVMLFMKISP